MIDAPTIHLSFDDHFIDEWNAARPIFREYDVAATFFVSEFDTLPPKSIDILLELEQDGHLVCCHGLRHRNAVETIERIGAESYLDSEIRPQIDAMRKLGFAEPEAAFAYPVSARNERTDAVLAACFKYLRCGISYREWRRLPMTTPDLNEANWMRATSVDEGALGIPEVESLLNAPSKLPISLFLYAHCICDSSNGNHISPKKLAALFESAVNAHAHFKTFGEIHLS